MNDIIIIGVVSLGTLFILLAAIGLVRMPDLYLRISVTTKAATLGVGLLLLGTALYFKEISITTRAIAIIFFLLLTAPIGAHLIGRASYFIGVPLWKKSVIDDLKDKYDHKTHGLKGHDEGGKNPAQEQEELNEKK
ncbi:MAG: monovalent cation/H(+) antiporter subunit G [Crocinitomicaceae bacterium]|nr:monovalent cation/H(+) antiporter subunit G [Crocinitomicaceae bacterium]